MFAFNQGGVKRCVYEREWERESENESICGRER